MKPGPNDCYEKGKSFTVAIGWTDCELFPEELILNLLLAGETFNSFRMEGIKNIIFGFGQKIYKLDFWGEYKRRSDKYLFVTTTKIVTKLK